MSGLAAAPYVTEAPSTLVMPRDGSPFGAQINAFIADNMKAGISEHVLGEGRFTLEVPVDLPSNGVVRGSGAPDTYTSDKWMGGTQAVQTPGVAAFRAIGTSAGNSLAGMKTTVWLENIHAVGMCGSFAASTTGAGNPRLFDFQNCYRPRLYRVGATGWGIGHFRFNNCWDWYMDQCSTIGAGLCDPYQASTAAYTQRIKQPIEQLFGPMGIPAIEVISTGGPVNTNNGRITGLHAESTPNNAVLLYAWGANGNGMTVTGLKMEGTEGSRSLIVLDNQDYWTIQGEIIGGGLGSAPSAFGSIPAGRKWNIYTNPGLVLANNCRHLNVAGTLGYIGGKGVSSPLSAFVYLRNCANPQVNIGISQGLDCITGGARIISIGGTDDDMLRAKAYPYLDTVPGACMTEVLRA